MFRWDLSSHKTVVGILPLFIAILTACLLCIDTASGLSFRWVTAPLFTAILISWPTIFIPDRWRGIVQFVVGEILIVVCLVDCFCQEFFCSPITPQILSNIILTDWRETQEFFSAFVNISILSHWRITALLFVALLLPSALLLQDEIDKRLPLGKKTSYAGLVVFVLCLFFEFLPMFRYAQLFFQQGDFQRMEGLIFRQYHAEVPTPLHRFLFAYYSLNQSSHTLEDVKRTTYSAQVDSCSFRSPHIVLVVGESYNKHHSTLYGYHLPTTPLQQKRKDAGDLYVFNDVVSPWNITSNAMLGIFSLWEYGLNEAIGERPLVPVLFRRAGYQVNFFSNQYLLRGFRKGFTNQAGHFFLADIELSDSLFTYRNEKTSKYDLGLVDQVRDYKRQHGQSPYTLDILHLIGQHFEYSERYPKSYTTFSLANYQEKNLSAADKAILMQYDQATYYNDVVLDSIISLYQGDNAIVLFVSDHGEEAFDEGSVSGRLFQEPTASQARYEFEVPMWIWCSDSYRQSHPDVIRLIRESVNKPFLSDGMPQLLLSLAGISCPWRDDTRNLLSPRYQPKKRIIGGSVDYDELMQDSVQ